MKKEFSYVNQLKFDHANVKSTFDGKHFQPNAKCISVDGSKII